MGDPYEPDSKLLPHEDTGMMQNFLIKKRGTRCHRQYSIHRCISADGRC
jgi:hypothetical protein